MSQVERLGSGGGVEGVRVEGWSWGGRVGGVGIAGLGSGELELGGGVGGLGLGGLESGGLEWGDGVGGWGQGIGVRRVGVRELGRFEITLKVL